MQEIQAVNAEPALPILKSVQPILAVSDILATVAHWQDVLGFPGKWTWGDPPVHAGVNWGETQIQFSMNPEVADTAPGHSMWINVGNIDALYAMHKRKGAEILAPLETKPWGVAEYSVRDNSGYTIRFAAPASDREKSAASLPSSVRIVSRAPTPEEYVRLRRSVGWYDIEDDSMVIKALAAAVHAVVAEDAESGEAVAAALLLGDGASFYYVKDVIVHPDWQSKRVGTAVMRRLIDWANANAPDNAMMALFTGENLKGFYGQFGFAPGFGMVRTVRRRGDV